MNNHTRLKHFLSVLLLAMAVTMGSRSTLTAQGSGYDYMNDWYQFNQNYLKVLVSKDGPYRVSLADLTAAGVTNLGNLNPDNLQVFYRGEEIPVYVEKNGVELSFFEFYGKKNDGHLDSLIYRSPYAPFRFDPTQQPNTFTSFFTDTSAYFITWDAVANARYTGVQPTNYAAYTPEPWWRYRVLSDFSNSLIYFQGGGGATEVAHVLNPDYITGEGFLAREYETGDLIDRMATNVPTPGFANSGNPTKIVARVIGTTTAAQHITAIDVLTQDRYIDTTAGINIKTHSFDFNLPLPGTTLVRFHAYGNGSKPDKQRVAWHYIEYDRLFRLNNDSTAFIREFNHSDTTYLRFTNAKVGSQAWLLDPANNLRIEGTVSNDTLKFLVPGAPGERSLYMYTDKAVRKPIIKARTSLSNLSDVNGGAEFVIITHRRFANSAQKYALYRDTTSVNRYTSKVVYVDEIMDEFGYGSFTSWAIKNFCKYALDNWATKPRFFLLWGKGRSVHKQSPTVDYVPSFGYPANDYEFVSDFDRVTPNFEPQAGIGRVSIYNDSEGLAYLAKIDEYEHMPYAGWMKKAIMMGGGKTGTEQDRIRTALVDRFKPQLEDLPIGGEVSYFQTEGNGIESNTEKTSAEVINAGVGIIHFFGHSGTNIFDVDIQEANRYTNYSKYPFMLAFGCYGGNFLETSQSFGERFILEPGRGSIGYLANSTAGFLQQLSDYGNTFYSVGTGDLYGQAIGDVVRETIKRFANTFNGYSNLLVANHSKQMNLQGDPSLVIRFPSLPDLSVAQADIFFTPENLSAQDANYALNVVVHNEGSVFQDSFALQIRHRPPNGQAEILLGERVYGPFSNIDTLVFPIENTLGAKLAGLNHFDLFVDSRDSLQEYSEANNRVTYSTIIQGNIPAILFPYEYAIVGQANISLSASTYLMSPDRNTGYIFEIDTVHTFSSPFRRTSGLLNGTANYGSWELPFALSPGQVYYWRVRLGNVDPVIWNESSFRYVPGKTGWSQSKAPQFTKDVTEQVRLDQISRQWQFDTWSRQLHAYIETVQGSNGLPVYFFGPFGSNGIPVNGVMYTAISHRDLSPSVQGTQFGDWRFLPAPSSVDPYTLDDLIAAILATPDRDYFLIVTAIDPRFGFWTEAQKQSLEMIGVRYEQVKNLQNGKRAVIFGRKGDPPGTAVVILEPNLPLGNQPPRHDLLTEVATNYTEGNIRSTRIGPTTYWQSLEFDWSPMESLSKDSLPVDVTGMTFTEVETLLGSQYREGSTPLTFIDAAQQPYMRLEGKPKDALALTAPQLNIWEVYYTPVADAIADPAGTLIGPDTIQEGEIVNFTLTARNGSDYDLDSLLVRYSLRRADRNTIVLGEQRYAPIAAKSAADISFRFHSANKDLLEGDAVLVVELNPEFDQPEQYQFNNFYFHPLYVKLDHVGPILDVTVDGKHLMDGDIIAPDPEIVVQLNDENAYLPVSISDTTYRIWFGPERTHTLNPQITISGNSKIESIPGQLPENKARLIFKPGTLADGEYTLAVQGFDFKGNQASNDVYKIHFNVVNEKSISDVLPYPNPFSTSTRFVYTLTGGERPYRFDIEIFTITGRLVKSIDLLAEGGVNFGYNITEYAWDGRDEFGDLLANGVYIYRVNVKFEDRFGVTHRDEGLPENVVKNGFGKMYIMR